MPTSLILRFIVFAITGVLLLEFMVAPLLIANDDAVADGRGWIKVNNRIQQSKLILNKDVIIVGDSVANQIYPFKEKDNYLATNGSVYPAGNLILIANALTANPEIKRVLYLVVPHVVALPFERQRSYPYFIKPFFRWEYLKYFEPFVLKKMLQHPGSFLTIFDAFRVLPLDDIDFSDGQKKHNSEKIILSDFSLLYLKRMQALCANRNVKLVLRSPPVPRRWQGRTHDWEALRKQIKTEDMKPLFAGYFESLIYLNDKEFSDGLHIEKAILKKQKDYWQKYFLQ